MKSKIVGTVITGVEDVKGLLKVLSEGNYALTVREDKYELGEMPEWCVLTESLEMWGEKYAYSVYDNPDIEDWEEDRYINSFPKNNSFSIKEYMENLTLQEHIDSLLACGLFLTINKETKCFELYYEW